MVNKSRGEMAYTLVDVDSPVLPEVQAGLRRDRRRAGGALPAGALSAVQRNRSCGTPAAVKM